jgi:hypothetical protein
LLLVDVNKNLAHKFKRLIKQLTVFWLPYSPSDVNPGNRMAVGDLFIFLKIDVRVQCKRLFIIQFNYRRLSQYDRISPYPFRAGLLNKKIWRINLKGCKTSADVLVKIGVSFLLLRVWLRVFCLKKVNDCFLFFLL